MKTVLIQKRRSANNPHEIMLGNGARLHFTSKRNASQFIAETNRFLTKALVNINLLMADCYREYRLMWFISANVHKGTKNDYWKTENSIKDHINTCEMLMGKFGKKFTGSDDPFFAFIDLKKIALHCGEAARICEDFHRKRNNTHSYYNCQNIADRCLAMVQKLENYNLPNYIKAG